MKKTIVSIVLTIIGLKWFGLNVALHMAFWFQVSPFLMEAVVAVLMYLFIDGTIDHHLEQRRLEKIAYQSQNRGKKN